MRALLYFPIIHTPVEMGKLEDTIVQASSKKMGLKMWEEKLKLVEKLWEEIEEQINSLDLPYAKVRLYQDGLPICDRESEIVHEVKEKGSRNHKLLAILMERGATIMGTESPPLLREEYELAKQTIGKSGIRKDPVSESPSEQSYDGDLLERRDRFIANRINSTLGDEEMGILFLGMLHSISNFLDKDIKVICPCIPIK